MSIHNKFRLWFSIRNVRLQHHVSSFSLDFRHELQQHPNVTKRHELITRYAPQTFRYEIITIAQTRTTVWVGEEKYQHEVPVGVVLVDPTSPCYPVGMGRLSWLHVPYFETNFEHNHGIEAGQKPWFESICCETMQWPSDEPSVQGKTHDLRAIVVPTLNAVCAEWLLVCGYVEKVLNQVEKEMEETDWKTLTTREPRLIQGISKWRTQIPIWRKMVEETLSEALPTASRLTSVGKDDPYFPDLTCDFKRIQILVNTLQERISPLSEIINTGQQLAASRQALAESRDSKRLTWLATIFIPLSWVSGLFSMTNNLASLKLTFVYDFATAIPLALSASIVLAYQTSVIPRQGPGERSLWKLKIETVLDVWRRWLRIRRW